MKKNNIPLKKLAQYRHTKFLISIENQALTAYNYVAAKMIADIKKTLGKEKLAKSEILGKGLKGDWKSDGHSFSHFYEDDPIQDGAKILQIESHKNGQRTGFYRFSFFPHKDNPSISHGSFIVDDAYTYPEHQRKGLASHAYKMSEDILKGKVEGIDEARSDEAKALWSQKDRNFGLRKSDDELDRGWTGEIPKIEADMDELLGPTIEKYMDAIRWALLGNYAGKDAAKAAKEAGLKDKITPGIIPSAYLQSLDSHQEHYADLFGKKPAELPKEIVKESLNEIVKRAKRFVDQVLAEFKNKIISSVDGTIDEVNFGNINEALESAKDVAPVMGSEEAVDKVREEIDPIVKKKDLVKNLENIVSGFESKFETAVRTNTSLASAIGTHQSMLEVYGREGDDLRVVNIEMEDEKVCSFCHKISKDGKGWIYYRLTDLQPSGYNFFRKRADWQASIAPQHHRCRCQSVYVPAGFELDPAGTIRPKKKS